MRNEAIARGGMGGFLNPPGHPEHEFHVATEIRRKPENRGMMALSSAVASEWVDPTTRAEAQRLLDNWARDKRPLDSPSIQEWILHVLGYFHNCYGSTVFDGEERWWAVNLIIPRDWDPMEHADEHAGVHFIRKYYPEYEPKPEDFGQAYWGTKPTTLGDVASEIR